MLSCRRILPLFVLKTPYLYILSVIDKVIKEVCLTNYLVISDYELQKSFIIKLR